MDDNVKKLIWLTIIPLVVMVVALTIGSVFDLGT
jgi:hypothetical protein